MKLFLQEKLNVNILKYHHRCICNEVNEINKGKKRQLRCMTDNKLFCDKSIELLS